MFQSEIESSSQEDLRAYLQGSLRDGTWNALHKTHRIGQADPQWLEILQKVLEKLDHRGWIYREGRSRSFWVLETTASFLSLNFDPGCLSDTSAISYARGYFDADGGMPRFEDARLYFQLCQKDHASLKMLRGILEHQAIQCGRIHNPSRAIDADYWRFFVKANSHQRFMAALSSWHPRKRALMERRLAITSGSPRRNAGWQSSYLH